VQAGTEADSVDGKPLYRAWTEVVPDNPNSEVVAPLTIAAGDQMSVFVGTASGHDEWGMVITDLTTGKSYTCTVKFTTPAEDAEVIHERSTLPTRKLSELPATSDVQFSDIAFAVEVAPGDVGNLVLGQSGFDTETLRIVMIEDAKNIAVPSELTGNCFKVADGSETPSAPPKSASCGE
jgi:hypothetical protein